MAIQKLTRLYEGEPLAGVNSSVIFVPVEFDFEIQKIKVKLEETATADVVFALTNEDGTTISGTTITIEDGDDSAILDGLTISRLEDADINLKLLSGAVNSTITLTLTVDDGETGGGGLTQEEVEDIVGAMFQTGTHMSFNYNDGSGKLEIDAIQLTTEEVQDKVGALLSGGANTTVTYNDGANTLTIAETTAGKTSEEIQDIVGALLAQGSNVTLTYDDTGNSLTIAASGGSGTVSGTSGKIAKFTSSSAVGDSNLSDDGTDITANDKTLSRFSAKINDQTGTTYTLDVTDNGKIVTFSNASAITVTIPSTLGLGFSCVIYQKGAGQVTVAAGSGATLRNPNPTAKTRVQYSTATVFSVVASEFVLAGDIAQS